jgi:signal transduction histidine kinase
MQIKKKLDYEAPYYLYILSSEKNTLRIACVVALAFSVIFIFIDYFRTPYFLVIVVGRSTLIVFLSLTLVYLSKAKTGIIYFLQSLLFSLFCIVNFSLDYFAKLPAFFLPNSLVLFCFVSYGLFGYSLFIKYWQAVIIITAYVTYSYTYSIHQVGHQSQIIHLTVNIICAVIVGYLIENYKRKSFLQNQILEESNSVKARLLSILSHDLISPLNSLKGLLSLHDRKLLSDTDTANYFTKIGNSLNETTDILQNLMRWSKTQMGGFTPSLEIVHIKTIIDEIVNSLASHFQAKELTLQIEIDDAATVKADKEMLRLALRNVLTNAIKFSRLGSIVVIAGSNSKDNYSLSITDEGVGMNSEQLEKVFSMKSVSTNGTLNEKGSGIGLTIVKEFTERFGGSVSVNSELQKGSTFTFDLPKE